MRDSLNRTEMKNRELQAQIVEHQDRLVQCQGTVKRLVWENENLTNILKEKELEIQNFASRIIKGKVRNQRPFYRI